MPQESSGAKEGFNVDTSAPSLKLYDPPNDVQLRFEKQKTSCVYCLAGYLWIYEKYLKNSQHLSTASHLHWRRDPVLKNWQKAPQITDDWSWVLAKKVINQLIEAGIISYRFAFIFVRTGSPLNCNYAIPIPTANTGLCSALSKYIEQKNKTSMTCLVSRLRSVRYRFNLLWEP